MSIVGSVDSVWRYPVKSMRGEALDQAFVGFSGVYGDRLFAFQSAAKSKGFPWLTAREQREMLRYQPRFRHPELAHMPLNCAEAEKVGATAVFADIADLVVDVETPDGDVLAIDDLALHQRLSSEQALTLIRSHRALTDCSPVSLISLQTVHQLGQELGTTIDSRRFRANLYLNLEAEGGFVEDAWVGRSLRIGPRVVIALLARDARCAMITFDPDTGVSDPGILRQVAQGHESRAGVYGAVLVEGLVSPGETIELLDGVIF